MTATTFGSPRASTSSAPTSEAAVDPGVPVAARPACVRLFGLDVTDTTREEAARWMVAAAVRRDRAEVAFLNAHCVNVMSRDSAYRSALEGATRVLADGAGVRLAARAAGVALADNVNGTDLLPVLCRQAAEAGIRLFFLGGAPGVAAEAARRLEAAHPGLVVAGTHHGYFADREAEEAAFEAIATSGAGILLVGMGVPRQELWIARNRHRLAAPVVAGVGGLFDYYSGRIPRAPLALRRSGLEWAWRLAQEPSRLAGRYLIGNVTFLARLAVLRLLMPAAFGVETTRTSQKAGDIGASVR